jgi:hypothetical protein
MDGRSGARRRLTGQALERAYRNVGFVLLAIPFLMVAGFWIPYFAAFPKFDPGITAAVHVHAGLLFTWVALLVIQPLAIRFKAYRLHRFLGAASFGLMPLIVLLSATMILKEYRENIAAGASRMAAAQDEYLSAVQLLLLVALFLLAVARIGKRDVPSHMRYMLCIALVIMPAGLARTLGYWFGQPQAISQTVSLSVIDACLLALIGYDKVRGLRSRPYYVALLAYIVIESIWISLGRPV